MLLQLLSNDKKALATARRLGLFCQKPQPQGQASATHTGAGISRASNADAASAPAGPTRKQKKSAARITLRDELGKGGTAVPPLCSTW